jgi:hypothetical protein
MIGDRPAKSPYISIKAGRRDKYMMTQFCTLIPYRAALEDIVDEITARAPQACGFEFDEVVIVCDGIRSAATVASQLPFEVIQTADETESLSTQVWIRDQPGIEAEVAALTDQFAADFAAYRVIHIDAPDRDFQAIREILRAA